MAAILNTMPNNRKLKKLLLACTLVAFFYMLMMRSNSKESIVNLDKTVFNPAGSTGVTGASTLKFDNKAVKYISTETILQSSKSFQIDKPHSIDWNRFAYVFYATSPSRLLPVLINVKQLRKFKTKAKIHLMCSFDIDAELPDKAENIKFKNIMKMLEKKYAVGISQYETIKSKYRQDSTYWNDSFTKLHAFNLIQFDRVIYLDADSILNNKMDQLFFLPPALLATTIDYNNAPEVMKPKTIKELIQYSDDSDLPPTPLEYSLNVQDIYKSLMEHEVDFTMDYFWKLYNALPNMESAIDLYPKMSLASYVMVIMPDEKIFQWILKTVESKKVEEYDMEIINNIWRLPDLLNKNAFTKTLRSEPEDGKNFWLRKKSIPSLMIIPHEPYALLSGEFRKPLLEHSAYLTNPPDFGYLKQSTPILNIQRALKNGLNYKDIEDVVDTYPEIPYWDWAWRFDYIGTAEPVKELQEDIDIDRLLESMGVSTDGDKKNVKSFAEYSSEKENKLNNHLEKRYYGENDIIEPVGTGMGVFKFGWDSQKIVDEAVYIHWSDFPMPKPWEIDNEDDMASTFDKLGEESLVKCKTEIARILVPIDGDANSKASQLLEKEKKFAIRTCEESIESWKTLYRDYWNMITDMMQEIYHT